ncbi:MAG TPA: transcriptional regulator [Gemmatimonadota bacterium]|nr:transcriptional regulator [Gemmatimonadota bacterium]
MARARKPRAAEVREPLSRIDRLLEHRVRLAIAVLLSRWDRLSFSRLRELTGETDGSLGAHMRRMEETGYVSVEKEFRDRKPVTWYALAPAGRRALEAHLRALEDLIDPG